MLRRRKFGDLPDGTSVDVITLGGPGSIEAQVLTYGCIIASLTVPDARLEEAVSRITEALVIIQS